MKSALTRLITSGLEKTASRAAPANTQQRASSIGRSMKTQSNTGFFFSRDSLSPSIRQFFQAISRQATLAALRDSISPLSASGVSDFLAGGWAAGVQATLASSATTLLTTVARIMVG